MAPRRWRKRRRKRKEAWPWVLTTCRASSSYWLFFFRRPAWSGGQSCGGGRGVDGILRIIPCFPTFPRLLVPTGYMSSLCLTSSYFNPWKNNSSKSFWNCHSKFLWIMLKSEVHKPLWTSGPALRSPVDASLNHFGDFLLFWGPRALLSLALIFNYAL